MDRIEALATLFADAGVTPADLRHMRATDMVRVLNDATDGRGAEVLEAAIALADGSERRVRR